MGERLLITTSRYNMKRNQILQYVCLVIALIISIGCRKQEIRDFELNDNQTYHEKLSNVTQVLDREDHEMIVGVDSTGIDIYCQTNFIDSIKVGDILVSPGFGLYPSGFLRKVESVDRTSQPCRINTKNGSLDESFEELTFSTPLALGDSLRLRSNEMVIDIVNYTIGLEDIVGESEATRIKATILYELNLDGILEPRDVDLSANFSVQFTSNASVEYENGVEFIFDNNNLKYSFSPTLKIGSSLVSVTDKNLTFCSAVDDLAGRAMNWCDNGTFTLATLDGPRVQVGSLNFHPFGRIFFNASLAIQGLLGLELSNAVTESIPRFSISASTSGISFNQGQVGSGDLVSPSKTNIKIEGNVGAKGFMGIGMEIGMALYDSEIANLSVGVEGGLSSEIRMGGKVEGTLSEYLNNQQTFTGEVSAKASLISNAYMSLESDVSNQLGFDPSQFAHATLSLYDQPIIAYSNACDNNLGYDISVDYERLAGIRDCDKPILKYQVNSGLTVPGKKAYINFSFPDGSFFEQTINYDEEYAIRIDGRVDEGDVVNVLIESEDRSCNIADLDYKIPICSYEQWIDINNGIGATLMSIQRYNLDRGGNAGHYYNDDRIAHDYFGKLYEWDEAVLEKVPRSRGHCPEGSVVPTRENWNLLINHIETQVNSNVKFDKKVEIRNGVYAYRYRGAKYLKESLFWSDLSRTTSGSVLDILPGGIWIPGGNGGASGYHHIGEAAYFWTSTSINEKEAYLVAFDDFETDYFHIIPALKSVRASCRCIKK